MIIQKAVVVIHSTEAIES